MPQMCVALNPDPKTRKCPKAQNPALVCHAGVAGMPQMGEDEMLKALMSGSKVAKGKARRKKNVSRGMAALAELRA